MTYPIPHPFTLSIVGASATKVVVPPAFSRTQTGHIEMPVQKFISTNELVAWSTQDAREYVHHWYDLGYSVGRTAILREFGNDIAKASAFHGSVSLDLEPLTVNRLDGINRDLDLYRVLRAWLEAGGCPLRWREWARHMIASFLAGVRSDLHPNADVWVFGLNTIPLYYNEQSPAARYDIGDAWWCDHWPSAVSCYRDNKASDDAVAEWINRSHYHANAVYVSPQYGGKHGGDYMPAATLKHDIDAVLKTDARCVLWGYVPDAATAAAYSTVLAELASLYAKGGAA